MDMYIFVVMVVIIGGALLLTTSEFRAWSGLRQKVIDNDSELLTHMPADTKTYRVRGSDGAHLISFYINSQTLTLPRDTFDSKQIALSDIEKMQYKTRSIFFVLRNGEQYELKHLHPGATNDEPIQYYTATYSIAGNDPDTLEELKVFLEANNVKTEKI